MNFIVFDLEATCWRGRPPSMVQETIEIGAVKVNRYGEVLGSFNEFIIPVINPLLSSFCTELTSIEQRTVERAQKFPVIIEEFMDWAEIYESDYLLVSWGSFDQKMLIQDCKLHKIEYDWLDPYANLKRHYQQLRKLKNPKGLKLAVESEGFDFDGDHHRGIDDALNLAKIFIKLLDDWSF